MDTKIFSKNKKSTIIKQFFVCSVASVMAAAYGIGMGAPTVIIPQMRNDHNMTVSDEMASWTSSVINFSGAFWVIVLATLSHIIGRKKTTILSSIISSLGFIGLYCSTSITQVLVCEVVLGVNAASIATLSIMINTEYSNPKYRGILDTMKGASFFWGVLLANAVGTFVHWRNIGIVGIISGLYTFAIAVYMPESPEWLASKGKFEQCTRSHNSLKGYEKDATDELEIMIRNRKRYTEEKSEETSKNWFIRYVKVLQTPEIYKAFMCACLLNLLYDWCGKMVCTVYAVDILRKITKNENLAYISMLVIDCMTVVGMYLSSILVKLTKRKTLQTAATVACIVTLFITSGYLYLVKFNILPENSFIVISLLVIYSLCVCAGPIIMTLIIYSEIIPVRNRTFSFILLSMVTKASKGFFLKIAPYLLHAFDVHGTFLFFAIISSILEYIIHVKLPETKDKTLDEIANSFGAKDNEILTLKNVSYTKVYTDDK